MSKLLKKTLTKLGIDRIESLMRDHKKINDFPRHVRLLCRRRKGLTRKAMAFSAWIGVSGEGSYLSAI